MQLTEILPLVTVRPYKLLLIKLHVRGSVSYLNAFRHVWPITQCTKFNSAANFMRTVHVLFESNHVGEDMELRQASRCGWEG